jgi:hypothetical protein
MSRSPSGSPRLDESFRPGSDPHPKGLRKKNWSQSLLTVCKASFRKPDIPREANAGPCEPSRRLMTWGPPRPGVTELTTRTPASLKGYQRDDLYLSRLVLADECNRPNCQRNANERACATSGIMSTLSHDSQWRCLAHIHRHHRPVQCCSCSSVPRPSTDVG